MDAEFPGESITPDHITGYMMFRIVGNVSRNAPSPTVAEYSGSVKLDSFLNYEVGPLVSYLRKRGLITFGRSTVGATPLYQMCREYLRNVHKEANTNTRHGKTHPLWASDEARLVSCLTTDAASLRDHAMIVIMRASACRVSALCQLRTDFHILQNSSPLTILIPETKTGDKQEFQLVLSGEDEIVVRRWLNHRRMIHRGNPYIFITKSGEQCKPDDISEIIKRLSQYAGYGYGFFSAHSLRHGHAARQAAQIMSQGGGLQDIRNELSDGNRWSVRSKAVLRYFNMNEKKYFGPGYDYSLEEFEHLNPEILHNLFPLESPQRRPLGWFGVPDLWIQGTCIALGCLYEPFEAEENMARIATVLSERYPSFNDIVVATSAQGCNKGKSFISRQLVGCLLQEYPIQIARLLDSSSAQQLINTLQSYRCEGDARHKSRRASKVIFYRANSFPRAQAIANTLSNRSQDKRTHILIYPDQTMCILRAKHGERDCYEQTNFPPYCPSEAARQYSSLGILDAEDMGIGIQPVRRVERAEVDLGSPSRSSYITGASARTPGSLRIDADEEESVVDLSPPPRRSSRLACLSARTPDTVASTPSR